MLRKRRKVMSVWQLKTSIYRQRVFLQSFRGTKREKKSIYKSSAFSIKRKTLYKAQEAFFCIRRYITKMESALFCSFLLLSVIEKLV